jgi:hypothetical protein
MINNLVREKVGDKICNCCKDTILKTQWRYRIYEKLENGIYDIITKKYVHANCYDNYLKANK